MPDSAEITRLASLAANKASSMAAHAAKVALAPEHSRKRAGALMGVAAKAVLITGGAGLAIGGGAIAIPAILITGVFAAGGAWAAHRFGGKVKPADVSSAPLAGADQVPPV